MLNSNLLSGRCGIFPLVSQLTGEGLSGTIKLEYRIRPG